MSMSYNIPNDPNMLLSYVNMMLRDRFSSFEEFCAVNDADMTEITEKLGAIGYTYDEELNQFK
jgi:hypothetical protein